MAGPLTGIKVLDAGLLVQGPQAAALLTDMGAETLKIELPGIGDQSRYIHLSADDARSAYFTGVNRGKRGVTIDLRIAAGAEIFKRIAADADVVISNFKPGTMEAWGLGFDDLAEINPGIIWGAGSAFGPVGPDSEREGADLAGQSAGGLISTVGADGEPPSPVGVTIADHIASLNLASGILAALYNRAQTGRGQRVEVSLLGGQIWAQASEYSHFLMSNEVPGRSNYGHPLIRGLYRIFETADGWIGIIGLPATVKDDFFIELGRPELGVDERFQKLLVDRGDLEWLGHELEPIFRERTTDSWSDTFRNMGVRYAPVRDYAEAAADPGAWENGYFQELPDASGAPTKVVGTPIRMSATPLEPGVSAPGLSEHTDDVLRAHGYTDDDIERFRAQGAI
jgi:CoA:oxalate CoA-transferase